MAQHSAASPMCAFSHPTRWGEIMSVWPKWRSACARPFSIPSTPCLKIEPLESRTVLSGAPPTVLDFQVSSTEWTAEFHTYLETHSMGNRGYRIPTGSPQSKSLSWHNIDQLIITFSSDVNVEASDLSISGVNKTSFPITHFIYDAFSRTATWTLAAPLPKNVYQIDLDGDGLDPVSDLNGVVLDGEWTNNSDTYSSGNGIAGGDFAFVFRVLPGDITQNSTVDSQDQYALSTVLGTFTYSASYKPFADLNGSGAINLTDSQKLQFTPWGGYPTGSPVGVANDAPTTKGGYALDIDDAAVDVAISLYDSFSDAETPINQLAYEIVSVSNPSLFDSTTINSTGMLVLNAANGKSGRSEIVIKATDAIGLNTFATYVADIAYANQVPVLYYTVEPVGANTFRVFGMVGDDDSVEGLFVEFQGSFDVRTTVGADGWFEFSVIVHEPDWGLEWARVSDFQELNSDLVERYVGVT
jgi:hypothetical protein